ncbi:MAG: peptidoglycan DD-metalloendopeptidase family protein [Prevotellaceae bacterium]|jgi:murein DD-endopeptidase MepM/ murein hydrolase activator NlpD|nr:peptidoglycan DD-metalloendopeptidase family protein [Prevotellaceae bacterium]
MPKSRIILLCTAFLFASILATAQQQEETTQKITPQQAITDYFNAMPVIKDTIPAAIIEDDEIEEDNDEEFSFDELDETATNNMVFLDGMSAENIYKIWSTDIVNPYNIRLTDKADTTLIDLSGYVHPTNNVVTSEFGFRRGYRFHYGIDVRLKKGDSVLCAFDGTVRIAKRAKGYGYCVVVRHHNGLETVYGHFSKLAVKPNEEIKAGGLLGYGGSTGRSSGPHLHYEIRYLGIPLDPRMIVDFDNYSTKSDTMMLSAAHFAYAKEIEQIRFWTVRKGDTLGKIAQKTSISISKLCQLNKITTKSVLRIGQKIRYT